MQGLCVITILLIWLIFWNNFVHQTTEIFSAWASPASEVTPLTRTLWPGLMRIFPPETSVASRNQSQAGLSPLRGVRLEELAALTLSMLEPEYSLFPSEVDLSSCERDLWKYFLRCLALLCLQQMQAGRILRLHRHQERRNRVRCLGDEEHRDNKQWLVKSQRVLDY